MKQVSSLVSHVVKGQSRADEMIRFVITGGIATVVQYGVYVVFVEAVGVKAVPSTLISYAISFIANFFLSTYFTFKAKPTTRNGLGFFMSHIINMGLQTGLVAIFKELVGPTLALLPALAICIPTNYFMVRYAFKGKLFTPRNKRRTQTPEAKS